MKKVNSKNKTVNPKLVDANQVQNMYSVSRATLHRLVDAGKIPKPKYLLGKRVWKLKTLDKAFDKLLEDETTVNNLGKS